MLVNWHEDFQIFTDQSKISASSRLRVGLKLKRLRCHLATSLKEKPQGSLFIVRINWSSVCFSTCNAKFFVRTERTNPNDWDSSLPNRLDVSLFNHHIQIHWPQIASLGIVSQNAFKHRLPSLWLAIPELVQSKLDYCFNICQGAVRTNERKKRKRIHEVAKKMRVRSYCGVTD